MWDLTDVLEGEVLGKGQSLSNEKRKALSQGADMVQQTHQPKRILSCLFPQGWSRNIPIPGAARKLSCCFTPKGLPGSVRNGGFEGKNSSLAKGSAALPWRGGASFVPAAAGSQEGVIQRRVALPSFVAKHCDDLPVCWNGLWAARWGKLSPGALIFLCD